MLINGTYYSYFLQAEYLSQGNRYTPVYLSSLWFLGIIFESSLLSIIFSLELKIFLICYSSNKKQLFSICLSTPTGNFIFFKLHFNVTKLLKFFLRKHSWDELREEHLMYIYCAVFCAMLSCSVVSSSLWSYGTVACQAPLAMEFSRQEYWSGLPCPPAGDHPNPGIKPGSPALQVNSLPLSY